MQVMTTPSKSFERDSAFEGLDHFLRDSQCKTSVADVLESLKRYAALYRIEAMAYYFLPPAGASDHAERYVYVSGFGDSALKTRSLVSNPLMQKSTKLTRALFWNEVATELALTAEQNAQLKTIYCADGDNGLVVPGHGPNGRNACFVMRFSACVGSFSRQDIRILKLACQAVHEHICVLRQDSRKNQVRLTRREREVMSWVARGKSNRDIATIVGISPHTVNGYLRRIYLKTGTNDRTTATLRVLGDSLIDY